jgi:hypothetical protein
LADEHLPACPFFEGYENKRTNFYLFSKPTKRAIAADLVMLIRVYRRLPSVALMR